MHSVFKFKICNYYIYFQWCVEEECVSDDSAPEMNGKSTISDGFKQISLTTHLLNLLFYSKRNSN